jgi:hypothetical protein
MMGKHFPQLCDYDCMCFLTTQCMNELNINLQGLKHLANEVIAFNTLRTAHDLTRFTALNMADRSQVTSFLEHDKLNTLYVVLAPPSLHIAACSLVINLWNVC